MDGWVIGNLEPGESTGFGMQSNFPMKDTSPRIYRYSTVLVILFLIALPLAVYLQILNHEFVTYDDDVYITHNPHIRSGLNIESIKWAFTATRSKHWHPLTWLSHMLDYQLFGVNPAGHHFINLLLHLINVLLLYVILNRSTQNIWQSAFVAAVFALHPLHVETVAWVSDRKDLLSTLFWMLAMTAYISYSKRPRIRMYLLMLSAFLLGLMAKPIILTLPLVLLAMDYWPLCRFRFWHRRTNHPSQNTPAIAHNYVVSTTFRLFMEKLPLLLLTTVSGIVTLATIQDGMTPALSKVLPHGKDISNALVAYVIYLGKAFWPTNLAVNYSSLGDPPLWEAAGAVFFLLTLSFLALWTAQQRPYLIFGWFWYLITLVPVIGIIRVGPHTIADRFAYLPMIGLYVMVAWGAPEIISKWRHRNSMLALGAGGILLSLLGCSWVQAGYWKDSITLYRHAIAVTENNYLAHNNLGNALARQGKYSTAISHYKKALEINPNFDKIHNNLGIVFAWQGKTNKAIRHFKIALKINPENAKAHNNLGKILARQGKTRRAIVHFKAALRIDPDYTTAQQNLQNLLSQPADDS